MWVAIRLALPMMFGGAALAAWLLLSDGSEQSSETTIAGPTPAGQPSVGTTCAVEFPPRDTWTKRPPGAGVVAVRFEPFCVGWTDAFDDETGFRVEIGSAHARQVYHVAPNVNDLYPPPDSVRRPIKDLVVTVWALTPAGDQIVGGFALTVD
jgi:hypothetical protein